MLFISVYTYLAYPSIHLALPHLQFKQQQASARMKCLSPVATPLELFDLHRKP